MSIERTGGDFTQSLNEQKHLLQKSVDAFYCGDAIEALHISKSIRVLIHETFNQDGSRRASLFS
jgi:hypothetical protein